MRVEHLVGLVVSDTALIIVFKDDDDLHGTSSFKVCLQILSLSGTNPFPLAASLLLESFLPEFLRRAAAFRGSSFLRRLVVSCTEKCMTSISRQSQHCVTDTVFFFFFLKECHNLDFFLEELEHPLPEVVSQVL